MRLYYIPNNWIEQVKINVQPTGSHTHSKLKEEESKPSRFDNIVAKLDTLENSP